jgi:DegV family protein with EDD domain
MNNKMLMTSYETSDYMTTIKIISDSGSDLPSYLAEKLDVSLVPLSVRFGSECMPSDLEAEDFYARMKQEKELPQTSSPSPHDFLTYFRQAGEGRDILVIALSASLSSTYNHAVMAKEMLLEEGYQGRIEIIDSKTASLGLGLIVYKAARLAQTHISMDDLLATVETYLADSATLLMLDTLENVIKGGRLDRVRGAVASMLNIKLLMQASDEGNLEVIDKIRGTQLTIKRLIEKVGEARHNFEKGVLAIAHSNCEERARSIMDQLLLKYPFRDVIFANMGPVIGTYAGEGGVLVSY